MRAVLALLMLVVVCGAIFVVVRARIRRAPHLKAKLMTASIVVIVLGVVVGGLLPTRVPETSGSPASLVLIVVLWLIGGGLIVIGVPALLASLMAVRHDQGAGRPAVSK